MLSDYKSTAYVALSKSSCKSSTDYKSLVCMYNLIGLGFKTSICSR